jgi:similar to spore coat protein
MSATNLIAPHEILELHEIVQNEVACARKLQANMNRIQDQELKTFMQNSLQAKRETLSELKSLYYGQQLQ